MIKERIYQAHEELRSQEKNPRMYLGASYLGDVCERKVWFAYRHALPSFFKGQLLKIFRRGHNEEAEVFADLRLIGAQVQGFNENGSQIEVSALNGHLKGHLDAVVRNLPAPYFSAKPQLLEIKTAKDERFKKLCKEGVEKTNPTHYGQMQIYMGLTNMESAIYYCVNKNDDDIYTEQVPFKAAKFKELMARAERVIFNAEPPLPISNDPSWFECKMCSFHGICHGTDIPQRNCRTCCHSTPQRTNDNGDWLCERFNIVPEPAQQYEGCLDHRIIPQTMTRFAKVVSADHEANFIEYEHLTTGNRFSQGGDKHYSTDEIFNMKDKRMLGDSGLESIKEMFGAKVVA